MNYCIISIIKYKKTETAIVLLSHRFYSAEIKKINDIYLIERRKTNERIREKNESFKDERSKKVKRHNSEKTNQLSIISNRISYLN